MVLAALAVVVSGAGLVWFATHAGDGEDPTPVDPRVVAAGPPLVSNTLGAVVPGDTTTELPVPRAVTDWLGHALPLSGRIVPVDGGVRGTVRLERTDGPSLAVRLDDLEVGAGHGGVRVALSQRASPTEAAASVGTSAATVLTSVPADGGSVTIALGTLGSLPPDVRTVVLLDDGSHEVLGTALLLPSD